MIPEGDPLQQHGISCDELESGRDEMETVEASSLQPAENDFWLNSFQTTLTPDPERFYKDCSVTKR